MSHGRLTRWAGPAVLAVLLASCQGGALTDIEGELGDELEIRIGQSLTVDDGGITIIFEAVTEDSRCPVDVTCVWEGNARLVMTGVVAGEERPFELNTAYNPVAGPREATVDGYLIELTGLDPHPRVGQSIPPARYRATLRVTHATTAAAAAL